MNGVQISLISYRIDRLELIVIMFGIVLVALTVVTTISLMTRRKFEQRIVLRGRNGNSSSWFGTNEQGQSEFILWDREARASITMGFCEDGNPCLGFFDKLGQLRFGVGIGQDGTTIRLFDGDGIARLITGIAPDGNPRFNLWDKDGKARLDLGLGNDGGPFVQLNDGEEKRRLLLGTSTSGEAALVFLGNDGKERIRVGFDADGDPIVHALDEEGRVI